MEKVKVFVVKHKWLVALLGGAIVLWLLLRGKGSDSSSAAGTASTGVDPNVQVAAIQAGAQQQTVQAQAVAQVNTLNAQLASQQSQQHFQLAEDTLAAQQNTNQTAAAATLASNQIGAQVQMSQIQADVATHADNTQTAVAEAGFQTQQNIADFAQQSLTNNTKIASDLQLGIVTSNNNLEAYKTGATIQGQVDIASLAADVATHQLDTQADIDNHVLGLIQSGALNKGGVAGANQNALVGAIAAPGSGVGPAIAQSGVVLANQPNPVNTFVAGLGGTLNGAGSFLKSAGTVFL